MFRIHADRMHAKLRMLADFRLPEPGRAAGCAPAAHPRRARRH
jgi:hypothetical protein